MIVNRILKATFPTQLCGVSLADAQREFLTVHDIRDPSELLSDETECLVFDDTPLLTDAFLRRLRTICLQVNTGFQLGDGYVKKTGYMGKLRSLYAPETRQFSPVYYSYFTNVLRRRILRRHAKNGVIICDENSIFIDFHTKIGENTVIRPHVTLENSVIGNNTFVGEGCVLRSSHIGDGCELLSSTLFDSTIGSGVHVGPYAFLRQNTVVSDGCRIGDFVEIKNSNLSEGVKAAHLCYIGDASVGQNTNVGCGTVFCNYDGVRKHHTTVGDNVFIGANTNLVAPITIGDGAFLAAGGTITSDVPDNAFVIGRSRPTVKPKKN